MKEIDRHHQVITSSGRYVKCATSSTAFHRRHNLCSAEGEKHRETAWNEHTEEPLHKLHVSILCDFMSDALR